MQHLYIIIYLSSLKICHTCYWNKFQYCMYSFLESLGNFFSFSREHPISLTLWSRPLCLMSKTLHALDHSTLVLCFLTLILVSKTFSVLNTVWWVWAYLNNPVSVYHLKFINVNHIWKALLPCNVTYSQYTGMRM